MRGSLLLTVGWGELGAGRRAGRGAGVSDWTMTECVEKGAGGGAITLVVRRGMAEKKKSGSDTGVDKADTFGFLWRRRLRLPLPPHTT